MRGLRLSPPREAGGTKGQWRFFKDDESASFMDNVLLQKKP